MLGVMAAAALIELRAQHAELATSLDAERDVLSDATSLDAECLQTLRSLAEDNARMNGLIMIERSRGEAQSVTHEAKLCELSRQGDIARSAAASRERTLQARIAKLSESVGRATALVGEKVAHRSKNARLLANNARMEHLLSRGSACVSSSCSSRMLAPCGSLSRAATLAEIALISCPHLPHNRSPTFALFPLHQIVSLPTARTTWSGCSLATPPTLRCATRRRELERSSNECRRRSPQCRRRSWCARSSSREVRT